MAKKGDVSISVLLNRLLRSSVMEGITLDTMIDYTLDFIQISGLDQHYEKKLFKGEIREYRVALPCDFVEENEVLMRKHESGHLIPARYATDTFHEHYNCSEVMPTNDYTYTINRDYLFASLENGEVEISYNAIQMDEDGYPTITDDSNFILALEWYVKVQHFTKLWEEGRLEYNRLENAKQEYSWAVARMSSKAKMPNEAQMEAIMNMFGNILGSKTEFKKRFMNAGAKHIMRKH